MRKFKALRVGNGKMKHYNKQLFKLVFVGKPFDMKDIVREVLPANLLANVLTIKLNNTGNYIIFVFSRVVSCVV